MQYNIVKDKNHLPITNGGFDMYPYSAMNVANYILRYYSQRDTWISNLKLQKILYFLQAQFMVSKNKPLFIDEIEAWDCGPIVTSVYHNFKILGGASIPVIHQEKYPYYVEWEDATIINAVLDELKPYTATDLLQIIHNQRPWKNAYYNGRNISIYELQDYFKD